MDTAVLCETEQWMEAQIRLEECVRIRMDVLFARQLGINRSQVKGLCEAGYICEGGRKAEADRRVRDGQVFYISREWKIQEDKERKIMAVGQ